MISTGQQWSCPCAHHQNWARCLWRCIYGGNACLARVLRGMSTERMSVEGENVLGPSGPCMSSVSSCPPRVPLRPCQPQEREDGELILLPQEGEDAPVLHPAGGEGTELLLGSAVCGGPEHAVCGRGAPQPAAAAHHCAVYVATAGPPPPPPSPFWLQPGNPDPCPFALECPGWDPCPGHRAPWARSDPRPHAPGSQEAQPAWVDPPPCNVGLGRKFWG